MTKKGFTLIELMVTVTIMMIMTAIVIFNYNRFNESTLLSSFAYDMSLTIRQAQVYGVAAKESGTNQAVSISTDSVSNFANGYGIHFDLNSTVAPMVFFIDDNADKVFENALDTTLQTYTFQRGIKIKQLCVMDATGTCSSDPVSTLDITFIRPNPEATIMANGQAWSAAKVVLQNSDDSIERSIWVWSTGQISVQ